MNVANLPTMQQANNAWLGKVDPNSGLTNAEIFGTQAAGGGATAAPAPSFQSSASPVVKAQTGQATTGGAAAVNPPAPANPNAPKPPMQTWTGQDGQTYTNGPNGPVVVSPGSVPGSGGVTAAGNAAIAGLESSRAMLDNLYNAQLSATNANYASQAESLKGQIALAHKAWEATATGLNPYSSKTTSTNLGAYHNTITQKGIAAMNDLNAKAEQARAALYAGNVKAYMDIQQQMNSITMDVQKTLSQNMMEWSRMVTQDKQFQVQQQNVAADNFRGLLSGNLLSTADIDSQVKDGSIKNSPMYQEALKAGYDEQGAVGIIRSAAEAQEKKSDLEWAKFQMQLDKTQAAMDKQTAAQIQAAVISSVSSVPVPPASASAQEKADYYANVAARTAGGKTDFRIAQDMSNLQSVIPQLENIKTSLSALKDTDPLINMIASKLPWAEKTNQLEAYLNVSAAPLARLFGEKGTLAEGDVNRIKSAIGSATQPSVVRERLFNSLVDIVGDKLFNNISNYAYQGYNVSAYAPLIQSMQSQINSSKIEQKGWGGYQVGSVIKSKKDGKMYVVGVDGITPQ